MDIRIEGYDEYVKDFERLCSNPDEQPGTEEEIKEIVEEAYGERSVSLGLESAIKPMNYIGSQDSVDGQYHEFNFDAEVNDDGQIVLHYRPEGN